MKKKKSNKNITIKRIIATLVSFVIAIVLVYVVENVELEQIDVKSNVNLSTQATYLNLEDIPEYTDEICVKINDNKPYFTEDDYTKEAFEKYSQLDSLGRCRSSFCKCM